MGLGSILGGVASSLLGGVLGNRENRKATQAQVDSADKASQVQKEQYERLHADLEPYRQAGGTALAQMMGKMTPDGYFNQTYQGQDIYNDPSYNFRLQQGLGAVEQSRASQGGLLSGATLKALNNYAQDYTSQEYQNAYNRFNADQTNQYNRLSNLIGMGQNASVQQGNAGMQTAQAVANNTMMGANAYANGRINQGNNWANMLGELGTFAQSYYENKNRGAV
ncbi:MAG: DNA transfer protein p32 [Moraxella equi]|nr:DNA transfer protein p32 [Moraxella equi]